MTTAGLSIGVGVGFDPLRDKTYQSTRLVEETCPRCAEIAERIGVGQPAEKEGWGSMDLLTGGTAPAAEEICVCRHGKDTYCGAWDWEQPAEKEETFERSLLRADIKAGNAEAAEAQLQRIKRLEAEAQPAEEAVVAAASVLGLSREETDELVRLVRSEGIRTQPVEKEGT